jgi:hypothetical protein
MRFTQARTTEQVDLQALHRIRDQLVASRTRHINQTAAHSVLNTASPSGKAQASSDQAADNLGVRLH